MLVISIIIDFVLTIGDSGPRLVYKNIQASGCDLVTIRAGNIYFNCAFNSGMTLAKADSQVLRFSVDYAQRLVLARKIGDQPTCECVVQ